MTQTIIKWLLRSNNYLYYSIYIYLETPLSFKAAEMFLNSVEILSENLFERIEIQAGVGNHIKVSRFIQLYESKGLPLKCLRVINKDPRKVKSYLTTQSIDKFDLSYLSMLTYDGSFTFWKFCKSCHNFEFI